MGIWRGSRKKGRTSPLYFQSFTINFHPLRKGNSCLCLWYLQRISYLSLLHTESSLIPIYVYIHTYIERLIVPFCCYERTYIQRLSQGSKAVVKIRSSKAQTKPCKEKPWFYLMNRKFSSVITRWPEVGIGMRGWSFLHVLYVLLVEHKSLLWWTKIISTSNFGQMIRISLYAVEKLINLFVKPSWFFE